MNELATIPEQAELADGGANALAVRQAKEVEAQVILAKKFPRDEVAVEGKIAMACSRKGLAEKAEYCYSRGGSTVRGPSFALVSEIARCWGNVDHGFIEYRDEESGASMVTAYAFDLEANVRRTMTFEVSHDRHTQNGSYRLTDPRDIYEQVANNAARRERTCLENILPVDVVDDAVQKCRLALRGKQDVPLKDRVTKMVAAFQQFGVQQTDIEAKFRKKWQGFTEDDFDELRAIFNAIKEGQRATDWFVSLRPSDVDDITADIKASSVVEDAAPQPPTGSREQMGGSVLDEKPRPPEGWLNDLEAVLRASRDDAWQQSICEDFDQRHSLTADERDQLEEVLTQHRVGLPPDNSPGQLFETHDQG